jgi:transcriptional regulator with XRE-family HTH domain
MNAVGGHIVRLRKKANMTQQALAERLSVTRQAVSQWETGHAQPDLDTLDAIACVFGVDMTELIYGEKRKEAPAIDPQRRKLYLIGLIVCGVTTGVIVAALLALEPDDLFDPRAVLLTAMEFYVRPLFYIFLSTFVLCGCSLVWDIRIRHRVIRLVVLIGALALILFYYGSVLIFLHNETNIPELIFDMFNFTLLNPAIFLLPGTLLFLGLNGERAEKKAGASGMPRPAEQREKRPGGGASDGA